MWPVKNSIQFISLIHFFLQRLLLSGFHRCTRDAVFDVVTIEYIAEGEVYDNWEPLEYWKVNVARFADLAAMACDVLSVQGTSVHVRDFFP